MTMAVTVFFPGNWNMSLAPRDHQVTIRLDWSPMPSTLSPLSSGWSKLKTQVASSTTDADYDKVISQSPLHGIPPTMFLKCRKRWRNIAKLSLYQQVVCLSTASSSKITSTIWCIWIGTWHGSQSYIRVTSICIISTHPRTCEGALSQFSWSVPRTNRIWCYYGHSLSWSSSLIGKLFLYYM